jgi:16S rRNA C1402 (ribose-2'-O) methylase RsmI
LTIAGYSAVADPGLALVIILLRHGQHLVVPQPRGFVDLVLSACGYLNQPGWY